MASVRASTRDRMIPITQEDSASFGLRRRGVTVVHTKKPTARQRTAKVESPMRMSSQKDWRWRRWRRRGSRDGGTESGGRHWMQRKKGNHAAVVLLARREDMFTVCTMYYEYQIRYGYGTPPHAALAYHLPRALNDIHTAYRPVAPVQVPVCRYGRSVWVRVDRVC